MALLFSLHSSEFLFLKRDECAQIPKRPGKFHVIVVIVPQSHGRSHKIIQQACNFNSHPHPVSWGIT
jgi:hypothetical protein